MKKSKKILILSLCLILVITICVVLVIALRPKEPMQIIKKRTGIVFPESAEVIEFTCEKNGTFEAAVKIKKEDQNDLENQLTDHSFVYANKIRWDYWEFIDWEYLEDSEADYSYFCGGESAKIATYFCVNDFMIVPESDYCMVYIYYMAKPSILNALF